jgi:hypothetical protein
MSAVEERKAGFQFKVFDQVAERRGHAVQLGCSGAKATAPGDSIERFKL